MVKVLIGLFFGGVAIGALASHAVPSGAVSVSLPLRGGSFLVLHGGSKAPTNMHARDPKLRYAVDFVELGPMMRRARGLQPDSLDAFAIWGSPVVSPCAGPVVAAVDVWPDQTIGSIDADNPTGNHVVIRCGDVDVTLAHLQRGSIVVRPEQQVQAGSPVGAVGNSGASTEPHLHVHGLKGETPVPLLFDGEWLVRNAVVRK